MKHPYKKIKDKHNLTGRGRTSWKFYEALNGILGTRPAIRPPVVLETSEPQSLLTEETREKSDEEDVDEHDTTMVINEDTSEEEINET